MLYERLITSRLDEESTYLSQLSKEEVQSLEEYVNGVYYLFLNKYLRTSSSLGKYLKISDEQRQYEKSSEILSGALKKYSETLPEVVLRGTGVYEIDDTITSEELLANANEYVGRTIKCDSFKSTTTDKRVAERYTSVTNPMILVLSVSDKVTMARVTQFRSGGYSTSGEDEYLVDKNSSYTITKIYREDEGLPVIVEASLSNQ